jgi:hypothetical protein
MKPWILYAFMIVPAWGELPSGELHPAQSCPN